MTVMNLAPASTSAVAAPASPVAAAAPAKPRYVIVALPAHETEANATLARQSAAGYTKLETVYVVATPSSASLAFAVLSA